MGKLAKEAATAYVAHAVTKDRKTATLDSSSSSSGWLVPALLAGGVATVCYFLYKRAQDKVVMATEKQSAPLYRLQHPEAAATPGAAAPPAPGCWTAPTDAKNAPGGVFTITKRNGFLPLVKPLRRLPKEFRELDEIMHRLPRFLNSANPSALADAVASLPTYSVDVSKMTPLEAQCVYRDYSILVSAFLLEGKTKAGKARDSVPRNIAIPFTTLAKHLDQQWIMSYDSYCLSNHYSLVDAPKDASDPAFAYVNAGAPMGSAQGSLATYSPESASGHWHWDNLRLIRAFDGGAEETTFVTVHAEIESQTPALIRAYDGILTGLRTGSVKTVKASLTQLRDVIHRVVVAQLKMFNASNPVNYEKYVRPWIFGWRNSPDHPSGVVFQGVQLEPTQLRGETGAQSTIIPSLDLMLGITHKEDQLRAFLVELEAYRPKAHRDFLQQLRVANWGFDVGPGGAPASATAMTEAQKAAEAAAPDFGPNPLVSPHKPSSGVHTPHALRDFIRLSGDVELASLFNECVGGVWSFRDIHVTFSGLYIGRYTNRETATGGTPYKAYLRKHRDESITHQLTEFGEDAIKKFYQPSREEYQRDLDDAVSPTSVNGIPAHLMKRHAEIIAKYGHGDASLFKKSFPSGPEFTVHKQ